MISLTPFALRCRLRDRLRAVFAFLEVSLKIWVYIDGFNLYNGAVKNTNYKWLDLLKLSQLLRPSDSIERIKYFTAKLDARRADTEQPFR